MKQLSLLLVAVMLTAIGTTISAFWAVLLYYSFAVLRPQVIWAWALPGTIRWSLIAACLLFFAFFLHAHRLLPRVRASPVLICMFLYGLCLLASVLTAYDPQTAQHWGIEHGKVLLIAMLASLMIERLWQVQTLLVMIAIALGYLAWEINYQYFFENARLDVFHYGYGGLDNNGAGLMLAMGTPACYVLMQNKGNSTPRRILRGLGIVLFILISHAVMMTYSRGAMLSAIAGLTWLFIHHRPRTHAFAAVIICFLVFSVLAGPDIRNRFVSIRDYRADTSAQSRFDSWAAGWQMAWDKPLTGHGIRNTAQFIEQFGADRAGRTIHNQYIQIAADSGIPALICYLTMLAFAFVALQKAKHTFNNHEQNAHAPPHSGTPPQCLCLAIESSLIMFVLGGFFLSVEVFELPYLLLILAAIAPVLAHETTKITKEAATPDAENPCPPSPLQIHPMPTPQRLHQQQRPV